MQPEKKCVSTEIIWLYCKIQNDFLHKNLGFENDQ